MRLHNIYSTCIARANNREKSIDIKYPSSKYYKHRRIITIYTIKSVRSLVNLFYIQIVPFKCISFQMQLFIYPPSTNNISREIQKHTPHLIHQKPISHTQNRTIVPEAHSCRNEIKNYTLHFRAHISLCCNL